MPFPFAPIHRRALRHVTAAVLLACMGASASAQIYRCKDENGQTVISDRPCTAGGVQAEGARPSADAVAARIDAPQMVRARAAQSDAAYDFIPDRDAQQQPARHSKSPLK